MDKISRFRGSLLGLACGDALGAPLELRMPGSFTPITGMIDDNRSRIVKAGYWTDDTSMALCLAESLIETKGFDPKDQMDRYTNWYRNGYLSSVGQCFGIGGTTRNALNRYACLSEKDGISSYCGDKSHSKSGNGSLMRLCPVPLVYSFSKRLADLHSSNSSKTTHGSKACIDSCRFFSSLIIQALKNEDKNLIFDYPHISKTYSLGALDSKVESVALGSYKSKQRPTGSGYVVDCLESALWAFYNTDNFKDGALKAANLGNDADTTAAVYGQLAGAFYGVEDIPEEWLEKLVKKDMIQDYADKLYDLHLELSPNSNGE